MKLKKEWKLMSKLMFVVALSLVFASCNNSAKQKSAAAEEEIKQDIEEYVYPLISSFDVTAMLSEIEATYIVDIANDAANVEKYFTEQSKAVNLGVYSADLAYATTYNQKAQIQAYFKAIETLVGDLNMNAAVSKDLASEIENNLDNKEKLVELITDLTEGAYSYLNKQGRKEISYLILAGSAIEGLYLTTHISENTLQNPKIVETILYQKEPLQKLEVLMAEFKDTELTGSVYANIQKINEVFGMEEGTTAFTQDQLEVLNQLLDQVRNVNVQ